MLFEPRILRRYISRRSVKRVAARAEAKTCRLTLNLLYRDTTRRSIASNMTLFIKVTKPKLTSLSKDTSKYRTFRVNLKNSFAFNEELYINIYK